MNPQISLQSLCSHQTESRRLLIDTLKARGFGRVLLDISHLRVALQAALDDAQALEGFRFPPIDESEPEYTQARRGAFYALYDVARICLEALVYGEEQPKWLEEALSKGTEHPFWQSLNRQQRGEANQKPRDFCSSQLLQNDEAFSDSFFNLFNYDNGSLNPHADRSLLTAIYVRPADDPHRQSALWVKNAQGHWTNADAQLREHELVIMVGEDFEALPCAQALGLYGAEHAVRVDPQGEFIEHSHFRRDPESPKALNRKSAALILRQEPKP